ncbi:MAG TPA: hypothetical protein VGM84_20905 [Steroidobacteraceae bacterium]|jgi:hypothetical protein
MALLERNIVVGAAERLIERTSARKQTWQPAEDVGDAFITYTEKFSYIVEAQDADGHAPFRFEVYRVIEGEGNNPNNAVLVGELATGRTTTVSSSTAKGNALLSRLYAEAKTSSLGISGLADDLLKDLDD